MTVDVDLSMRLLFIRIPAGFQGGFRVRPTKSKTKTLPDAI